MLVCMGAAIVMAMGHYMQEAFQTGDPARLGAQVISGIGFYSAGILATLAVYLIMARFKKLEYKFILEDVYCGVYVEFNGTVTISDIAQRISGYGLEIEEVQMGKPGKEFRKAMITLRNKKEESRDMVLKQMEAIEGVRYAKYIF